MHPVCGLSSLLQIEEQIAKGRILKNYNREAFIAFSADYLFIWLFHLTFTYT